jgi:enoyl-CoA hydratase/carnithine racemase
MIDCSREGAIYVVTLNNGPNLIDPVWQTRMLEVLDAVETDCEGDTALVITGAGKFFSNGLDVEAVMALQGEAMSRFGASMLQIIGRLLLLPVPTVAAIGGHAFAAGAFLALACDYRIMREDRGWFCISEVDAGVPIGAPMMHLLKAKVSPQTARDAVLSGKRYGADDAIAAGFADAKAAEADLLSDAKTLVGSLASKQRRIFKTLKRTLYADIGAALGIER